jgi:hypothetical protein
MVIQEKRIFLCMETASKMIQNIRKEYFHICLKKKQKYLVLLIVHSMYKDQKKEQEE